MLDILDAQIKQVSFHHVMIIYFWQTESFVDILTFIPDLILKVFFILEFTLNVNRSIELLECMQCGIH